ncbi:aspartate aminotransferase family protein [Actinoplanes awajinensis]|uniref:DegT/DnrJ/EryC1/StrS aminotransferase n=1 Tax=Actinoplanes awajinensis subsp. mycoplanecinus TaxID=135947 RepID=A0A0X3URV2_9ACTN|nr:hypothetical protein [Actinoplanes awajinensis]KUL35321.1 hypothetical protein ADL15_14990 [Actinoplanes awajinensis subsp. mycoplanecinus]
MPPEPAVREIGSEFHWDPAVLTGGGLPGWLPSRRELFATGCGALRALLRLLAPGGRLHVPSYFCMGVAEALAECLPVTYYRQLPDGRGPRWETLRTRPGDVVLAQNLFGREDGAGWTAWIGAHPAIPVIEDHSHDPFSGWARTSTAAYAVASLRKTLPVPDGGLLWSPVGRELPGTEGPESPGAAEKLAAMLLKGGWLAGQPVPKESFRVLQRRGEGTLLGSAGPASTVTAAVLPMLDVPGIRAAGSRNVEAVRNGLYGRTKSGSSGRDSDAAPFRLPLALPSESDRDALLVRLAENAIFAPVHWRQDRRGWWSGDHEAAAWADRMLTLPVDHRCSPGDVCRIVDVVTEFTAQASRESKTGHIIRA